MEYNNPDIRDTNKEEQGIERNVLTAISSGQVKMRPRWQFILQAMLLATGCIIILLTIIYLVSFILFALHESGTWFVPVFGLPGWLAFFRRLPWVLIGCALLFIIVLQVLVRRYSFGYQRPLLASVLSIIGIVLICGAAISATRIQRQLFDSARRDGLPVFGGMYRGFGMPRFDDIHRGYIVQIATGTFIIADDDGITSTIIITPDTRLPFGDDFAPSDTVIVFGMPGPDRLIHAFGVQKIDNGD